MIRVVVTGSECTGKTTLARALARWYDTLRVPEAARRFVRDHRRPPGADDVEAIARGQIAEEEAAAGKAGEMLILDTDLLSTIVYARHYFGGCPRWIEKALEGRRGDLYLLAGIDVPWVPDGAQRDRGDRRQEMHALFADALRVRKLRFIHLEGPHEKRLATAVSAIDRIAEVATRKRSRADG